MMRIAFIAIEEDCLVPYATKCFKSYWEEDKDVSNDNILKEIILSCGMDDKKVFDLIQKDKK
jgi:predicted DsbA family dithiol-disulfide isomerase